MSRQTTTGKLAATAVKQAKPREKQYKLFDGGGLYLLVKPNGRKYWRLKYRIHGREKVMALGVYPSISLAEARNETGAAKKLISRGIDPTSQRRQEKECEAQNNFAAVATEWYEKERGRWSENHAERVLQTLKADVFPVIGNTPISAVSAQDALRVIRKIEERGALDVAGRVKQRMAAVFRYAIYTGRASNNPVDALKDVIQSRKVVHRAALPAETLPAFLRDLENYPGHVLTKLALELLILTFVRPGELRAARWEEFNLESKEWRIPAERMKMKEEHIIPLSDQAITVLNQLRPITGRYVHVFPNSRNHKKPMSENALGFAIQRRMGYQATAHGFRATASTVLNETGFRPEVIERQLAHAERNKVRAAYNRSQYLAERRKMMQWWADHLDALREGDNVVLGRFGSR